MQASGIVFAVNFVDVFLAYFSETTRGKAMGSRRSRIAVLLGTAGAISLLVHMFCEYKKYSKKKRPDSSNSLKSCLVAKEINEKSKINV